MTDDERDPLEGVEQSRRDFIKKMAVVAFAAPVISSFGMSAIAGASGYGKNPPKQSHPNQSFPNQSHPPCDDDKGHDKDHDKDHGRRHGHR